MPDNNLKTTMQKAQAAFKEIARCLRIQQVGGRRLLREELWQRNRMVAYGRGEGSSVFGFLAPRAERRRRAKANNKAFLPHYNYRPKDPE